MLQVEECLDYCHKNISAVLASPTNMGCISDKLRRRYRESVGIFPPPCSPTPCSSPFSSPFPSSFSLFLLRLAAKFTAMEVEEIIDKRDKIQRSVYYTPLHTSHISHISYLCSPRPSLSLSSKLFVHKIQDLFSPTHNHTECPATAATLHRYIHVEDALCKQTVG